METGANGPGSSNERKATRLRPVADVAARRVDAGTVLINLRTNEIYELNETGTRIWELLGEGCDTDEMRNRLLEEYEVEEDEAIRAIDDALANLRDAGLIEERDGD